MQAHQAQDLQGRHGRAVKFEPTAWEATDNPTNGPIQVRACIWCGAHEHEAQLMQCSACRAVEYCGRECQKKHWKIHKRACKNIASDKESVDEQKQETSFSYDVEEWLIAHEATCDWLLHSALPDGNISHILSLVITYHPQESNPASRLRVLKGEFIPRDVAMSLLSSGGSTAMELFEQLNREITLVDSGRVESRVMLFCGDYSSELQKFASGRMVRNDVGDPTIYLNLQKGRNRYQDMPWLETIKDMTEKGVVMKREIVNIKIYYR